MAEAITDRKTDYSQWYNDIVRKAGLADHSEVRGCMVIQPHGYAIWEKMKDVLDRRFKETGHVNAYFPLFIPKHFFNREAKHVEGFAKECAVVTHHRLKEGEDGDIEVDPDAELEEELIIRPTSETIIWNSFGDWIDSYRDLPLLINQWANVVRWEMRTRLFLRTSEFLWQEGHTAHSSESEARDEALSMYQLYREFAEEVMAMPVIGGRKTAGERFAGAEETYTIEAMMQDGKALQAGTSHFLGQNFAKAFDVTYLDDKNEEQLVWATSWGVSTRLIGGLIMTHSDDKGLVLPPRLAPVHVVIVPIPKPDDDFIPVVERLQMELGEKGLVVEYDDDERKRPGYKFADHEMRGMPVRIGLGKRELEDGTLEIARRDTGEKQSIPLEEAVDRILELMDVIQNNLFDRARSFRDQMITEVDDFETFREVMEEKGGFISAHWDGTEETEARIKDETRATIRCIPDDYENSEEGSCVLTGNPSRGRVFFAKAY